MTPETRAVETVGGDGAELLQRVRDARAATAENVGRPDDHRETDVGKNALRLLQAYGRPEIPVAEGAAGPLVGRVVRATYVHGEAGIGRTVLPPASSLPRPEGGVELIALDIEKARVGAGAVERTRHAQPVRQPAVMGPHGRKASRGEHLVAARVVDGAGEGAVLVLHRHRHRPLRIAEHEVGRAVERIDDPAEPARPLASGALLAEDAVIGSSVEQSADDELFAGLVELGDHVGGGRLGGRLGDAVFGASCPHHATSFDGEVNASLAGTPPRVTAGGAVTSK